MIQRSSRPARCSGQWARVLFVDNDADTRQAFARLAGRRGFLVDLAENGAEALSLAQRSPYPVVVTDLNMPGIDGASLVRRLRSLLPSAAFLVATSEPEVRIPTDAALQSAVTSVIIKPWDDDELCDALFRAVRLVEERQSLRRDSDSIPVNNAPILLLEDSDSDADLIEYYLSQTPGHCLHRVQRLEDALRLLESRAFSVILSDLSLPDARGLDTVLRIQNAAGHVPLIVLSGIEDDALALQAVEAGAQDYLAKGELSPSSLMRAISYARERKRAEKRLAELAHYDPLTRLANRTLFQQRLSHVLGRARRTGETFAVLFVDLDGFKPINDRFGHAAGDTLLVDVGRRLQTVLREYDTVARLGGDEFAAILDDLPSAAEAVRVAERILERLRQPVLLGTSEARISASVGIATFPDSADTAEDLLRAADTAMYCAKRRGRNTYAVHNHRGAPSMRPELEFKNSLREALGRDEFLLHYQPMVEANGRSMIAAEALLRWNRNGERVVPPGEFIPTLEESGDILWVGEWVIRSACRALRRIRERGVPLQRISVNLSALQLGDEQLVGTVASAMRTEGLRSGDLELEVTEGALMRDVEQTSTVLSELRAIGARIAMDNFGTGYSHLAALHRLPADVLKIDRSFVQRVGKDRHAEEITTTIVGLGHRLGFEVVAEGVETEEQRVFLQRVGCNLLQGYLFGRPGLETGLRPAQPAQMRATPVRYAASK